MNQYDGLNNSLSALERSNRPPRRAGTKRPSPTPLELEICGLIKTEVKVLQIAGNLATFRRPLYGVWTIVLDEHGLPIAHTEKFSHHA